MPLILKLISFFAGSSPDSLRGPDVVDNVIKTLQSQETEEKERITSLQEFQLYLHDGDMSYVKQNFK